MPSVQEVRIHAPLVIAEAAVLIFVCTVMVFLRLYTRKLAKVGFGLDDIAIAAALFFVIGMAVNIFAETGLKRLGYPSSVGDVGPGHPNANVASWPGELLQVLALGCIKMSFLFLYRRIFSKCVSRWFNWANWLMMFIIIAWMIGYFFTLLFLCGTDFQAYWTSSTSEHKCLPTKPVHLSYALSDVITGILMVVLIISIMWKLQMSRSRKFAIAAWFGLGAVTIAMSIVRTVICYKALIVKLDSDADFECTVQDITTLTSYFSLLEAGLGLFTACLPVQYSLLFGKAHSVLRTRSSRTAIDPREFQSSALSHRPGDRHYCARDPMLGSPNEWQKHDRLSSELDFPPPIHSAEEHGTTYIADSEKAELREEDANLDIKCLETSGYV